MKKKKNITLVVQEFGRYGYLEIIHVDLEFTNNKHSYLYFDNIKIKDLLFLKKIQTTSLKGWVYVYRAKFHKKDIQTILDILEIVYKDIQFNHKDIDFNTLYKTEIIWKKLTKN